MPWIRALYSVFREREVRVVSGGQEMEEEVEEEDESSAEKKAMFF